MSRSLSTGRHELEGVNIVYMGEELGKAVVKLLDGCPDSKSLYRVRRENMPFYEKGFSTLMPKHCVLYTIVIDSQGDAVIKDESVQKTDDEQGIQFKYVKPMYQFKRFLPNDSVVHAFFYWNVFENRFKIGVFDASKIGGYDLRHLSSLERHQNVWNAMPQDATRYENNFVCPHWSGLEKICVEASKDACKHFECDSILRLPRNISSNFHACIIPLKSL